MKKYMIILVVLCLIEGLIGWQNRAQSEMPQSRVTAAIEIQTSEGPAYLVCIETTDNSASHSAFANFEYKKPKTQASGFNLFPEPVTVALLAFAGYLFGSHRR